MLTKQLTIAPHCFERTIDVKSALIFQCIPKLSSEKINHFTIFFIVIVIKERQFSYHLDNKTVNWCYFLIIIFQISLMTLRKFIK